MSGVTRSAIVAGMAIGIVYTMSPLTLAVALIVAAACWLGMRDLGARERRWVGAAFVIAIAVRVLAIAALLFATDPVRHQFLAWFPDARFIIARSWWIRNLWLDVPIGPMNMFGIYDTYGASSFSYFLAAVQAAVGPAPYGVDLISVAALIVGILVLFRLTRRAYGPVAAVPALFVMLFWPTMLAWSVSALREASQFFLMAVALACAAAAVRPSPWRRKMLEGAGAAAAIYAGGTLRAGMFTIIALAIPIGLALRWATARASVAVFAAVGVIVVGLVLASRADVRAFVEYQTDMAASRHLGQAKTPGRAYKLLDARFYEQGPQSAFTVTRDEALRFFARSAAAFVFVPMPWTAVSVSELAIAPQQIAWYGLVILALLGVRAAWRRDAVLTALLASYAVIGLVVIAPNSGNTGTLVRHRDLVVPAVTCLAGVGLMTIIAPFAGRRARSVSEKWEHAPSRPAPPAKKGLNSRRRLPEWLNPIDAAGVLTALLAIGLGAATVRVFRTVPPVIEKVEPSVLENGNRRVRLQGHDLRRYLRVFIGPAGGLLVLTNPVNQKSEATLLMHTSSDAELQVPAEAGPGDYDLYVYDEGREVARRSSAFTLVGGATPGPQRHASGSQ